MDLDVVKELEWARAVLKDRLPQIVGKTIWGSPAGKKRLAKRLVALLPAHRTYVEPFVGSGAVLFAKEPRPSRRSATPTPRSRARSWRSRT